MRTTERLHVLTQPRVCAANLSSALASGRDLPYITLPAAVVEGQPFSLNLQRSHTDVEVGDFCKAWAEGRAGVLPRSNPPRLFYQTAADSCEPHAVLSVPPASVCPTFASCGCNCGCACLNPWALRGGVPGRQLHRACSTPGASQHRQWELLGDASARVGANTYAPGDLAWMRRPGAPAVDAVEDLVGRAETRVGRAHAATGRSSACAAACWCCCPSLTRDQLCARPRRHCLVPCPSVGLHPAAVHLHGRLARLAAGAQASWLGATPAFQQAVVVLPHRGPCQPVGCRMSTNAIKAAFTNCSVLLRVQICRLPACRWPVQGPWS